MSKFPYAYCEESGRLLEPQDVIDIFLQKKMFPRLQCPDESCRIEKPETEITPVCCNPDNPCDDLSPHFRTHVRHQHSESCAYEFLRKNTDYVIEHKKQYRDYAPDANLLKDLKSVRDTSIVPDIFVAEFKPYSEINEIKQEAEKRIQTGKTRDEAYRIARCCVPHTTGNLSLIIDIAEALDEMNERDSVPLALPGRKQATYENAFLSIYSLKHDYITPYIFCGGAKIHETYNGFLINYSYPLKYYRQDFPEIHAVTFLERSDLRPLLLRELEHFSETEEMCYVYSFSTHCLKETACPDAALNCCVVIEPMTSGSIVIRDRCLKRSQKSSR